MYYVLGREVVAEKEEVGECIVCWVGKWLQRRICCMES